MGDKRSRFKLSRKKYAALCDEVRARDNHKCKICRLRKPLHVHHIEFRSHGGGDYSFNLVSLCNDCHQAVHDRYVVVLPHTQGQSINADIGLRFQFINGWKPITGIARKANPRRNAS